MASVRSPKRKLIENINGHDSVNGRCSPELIQTKNLRGVNVLRDPLTNKVKCHNLFIQSGLSAALEKKGGGVMSELRGGGAIKL